MTELGGAATTDALRQTWAAASACFVPRSDRGLLVTVSGFDGVGKSTQVQRLGEHFEDRGRQVSSTRQPSAEYRRLSAMQAFTRRGGTVSDAQVLAVLAAADRCRHVAEYLAPRLAAGQVVICDRYVYDFFAVFAHRGLSPQFLMDLSVGLPKPDFAFLLRADTGTVLRRLRDRSEGQVRYEESEESRIANVLRSYDAVAPLLTTVDARAPADVVSERMVALMRAGDPARVDRR